MIDPKPLWTCPECGHKFVTRNMWRSCGHYALETHFEGKEPRVRELFDHVVAQIEQFGPLTVYAQKTRIVFQARTRFASEVRRKRWLILQVWLKRRVEHPVLQRVEMYTYRDFGHIFRLNRPEELDETLLAYLHEAYAHGSQ